MASIPTDAHALQIPPALSPAGRRLCGPLLVAVRVGAPVSIVRMLLESGADEWARTMGKWTPLDVAHCFNMVHLQPMLSAVMVFRGPETALPAILLGVHNGLRYIYDRSDDGLRAWTLCGKGRDHEH